MSTTSLSGHCTPNLDICQVVFLYFIKKWLNRIVRSYDVSKNNLSNLNDYFSSQIKIENLSLNDLRPINSSSQSVTIYKDYMRKQLLDPNDGMFNSDQPSFLINDDGNKVGYYVYFGIKKSG